MEVSTHLTELKYLVNLEYLFLKRVLFSRRRCCGLLKGSVKGYLLQNIAGETVYYAHDTSSFCIKPLWRPHRPYSISVCTQNGTEVFSIYHPLSCETSCFPCCTSTLVVKTTTGLLIGTVKKSGSIIWPNITIENPYGKTICNIEGLHCNGRCFNILWGNPEYAVFLNKVHRPKIGRIAKTWSDELNAAVFDRDEYGVWFMEGLQVEIKVLLLATCLLLEHEA